MKRPEQPHNIIFIPGLGDDFFKFVWLTSVLLQDKFKEQKLPISTHVHSLNWRANSTAAFEDRMGELDTLVNDRRMKGETVSFELISAGVAAGLLHALQNLYDISYVVGVAGWINLHEGLQQERNTAFVHAVEQLNVELVAAPQEEVKLLKQKTLLVQPAQDKRVPLEARIWTNTPLLKVPQRSHNAVTMWGLVRETLNNPLILGQLTRTDTNNSR